MYRWIILFAFLAFWPVSVFGQEKPAAAPPLEKLEALLLERSPVVAGSKARVQAYQSMVSPSGALPDPMVEFMWQAVNFPKYTVGTAEMSMIGAEFRQGLLYPGKRKALKSAAQAEVGMRSAELDGVTRKLLRQLRISYAGIYALDRERNALQSAQELLEMLNETAAIRYSTGEAEQEAVLKAQLELSRLLERLDDLETIRKSYVAAINGLLDRPGDSPLGEVAALPPVTSLAAGLPSSESLDSPEVSVREAAVKVAEKQLEVSKFELKPSFSFGTGFFYRGDLDHVATLRFGIEFPLWKKQKQIPMISARKFELEMARQELRETKADLRSEIFKLTADWDNASRQIRRYQEGILPQTSAALDAVRVQYLAGRGDFSAVIEDFNLWLEARIQLAKRESDRFTAWAELQYLAGREKGVQP